VPRHTDRAADHKAGLIDVAIRRLDLVTLHAEGIVVAVDAINSSGTPECLKNQPLARRAVKLPEPARRPLPVPSNWYIGLSWRSELLCAGGS
jgi:hypothetical protein